MHISKLNLVNYRNFSNTTLYFSKGVNTIIGENGTGKTNVFRAIRLLLDDTMVRSAFRMEEADFHRGLKDWRGHWVIISLEFEELKPDEAIQALFQHGSGVIASGTVAKATYTLIHRPKKEIRLKLAALADNDHAGLAAIRNAISVSDYESVYTGKSTADFADAQVYKEIVGDFEDCVFGDEVDDPRVGVRVPSLLSLAKEVSLTFIQALRDVVAEFHNNRTNPLLSLLKGKSGEIPAATMDPIVTKVKDLNDAIEALDDVQTLRSNVRDTIKDAAGETYSPSSLSIKSDLSDEADRLFQSLRLFVGESNEAHEGAIHELSLGGANLIFLTLKLLEFKYQSAQKSIANFLLIEEPEAHIHTHIQKTLFDRIAYVDTQIIYSTHSTHVSEVSKVQSVNVLGRVGATCEAFQPATGLDPDQIGTVQRYLDAIRSNLLFAKSVVLVEGDAEEILVPALFRKVLGVSLDELGISLINVRSTGFQNVALLFDETRIRKRCSIVTDLDAAIIDTAPGAGDTAKDTKFKEECLASATSGANRKALLDTFVSGNSWLSLHYAQHTFEVDFIAAGNSEVIKRLVPKVYKLAGQIATASAELGSGNVLLYGRRVLTMAAAQGKGWFALLLGEHIDHKTVIPAYIWRAVFFARPTLTRELYFQIFSYRLRLTVADAAVSPTDAAAANAALTQFRDGKLVLADLKTRMAALIPGDQIHSILAGAN